MGLLLLCGLPLAQQEGLQAAFWAFPKKDSWPCSFCLPYALCSSSAHCLFWFIGKVVEAIQLQIDLQKEYGLVLEGGGAKGAYQIGAWRALREAGVRIRAVAGTSVGALNGALICMDDFEKAEQIWENIRYSSVMDVDDSLMEKLRRLQRKDFSSFSSLPLGELAGEIRRIVRERGFDIGPLRNLIDQMVDEGRLRSSDRELYVVTYSLSDHCPMTVDVKEAPEGAIGDLLMASAYLLGFKKEPLGGKYYLDGGGVNNVPVDVLLNRGYEDIIVLRIYGYGVDTEKYLEIPKNVKLYHIAPRQDLGGLLEFDSRKARRNMALGYFDGMRMLYGLAGRTYYLDAPQKETYYLERLLAEARDIGREFPEGGNEDSIRFYLEEAFPYWARKWKLKEGWDYKELYLAALEQLARQYGISRFHIYTPDSLWHLIRQRRAFAEPYFQS